MAGVYTEPVEVNDDIYSESSGFNSDQPDTLILILQKTNIPTKRCLNPPTDDKMVVTIPL